MSLTPPPPGTSSTPKRERKPGDASKLSDALKNGATKVKVQGSTPHKSGKSPQIRIAKATYNSMLATRILKALGVVAVLGFIIYFCFAATIMRIIPTTNAGLLPVKNITYAGGLIPQGALVATDMESERGSNILDYLEQSFIPSSTVAIVEVEAGPWGTFSWSDGSVTFDEKLLPMKMPDQPDTTALENDYLVTCVKGACVPGQGYIVPASYIMGQYLGG